MDELERKIRFVVQAIISGDTDQFIQIIENYQKLVVQIIWRILPKSSDHEDIAQDVFLKVFHNLKKFRGDCKFSTWVGRITYNHCLNVIRKKQPELVENPQDLLDYSSTESGLLNADAAQLVEQQDLREALEREIAKLPVQQRLAILLFHIEEMKYEEISEVMSLPVGTIKSHLFRARKNLRNLLEKRYQKNEMLL